jgi:hypothetical protein
VALSLQEYLARQPEHEWENYINALDDKQRADLIRKPWWFIGRPEQQEPDGKWTVGLSWLAVVGAKLEPAQNG